MNWVALPKDGEWRWYNLDTVTSVVLRLNEVLIYLIGETEPHIYMESDAGALLDMLPAIN